MPVFQHPLITNIDIDELPGTPLEALFPVNWKAETGRPTALRLTERLAVT